MPKKKPNKKETVVILGDWFIDENWLVAGRKTYSSSHTGDFHYLSKHTKIDKRMISLCGASEILEVLRNYFSKKSQDISFIGFGAWNKNDNEVLQCTLCSKHIEDKHLTPYTLTSLKLPILKDEKRICPYEEKECDFHPNLVNLSDSYEQSTNRIIRCYEGYGGAKPHLLYRIDWELPVKQLKYNGFKKLKNENVTSVIIEDHGKGVVTPKCINKLLEVFGQSITNINWYIRSKLEAPDWMQNLKSNNINVRLKVIDYKLANYKKGQRRYRFGKQIGRTSIEILGELTGSETFLHNKEQLSDELRSERAAVYLEKDNAIAKDNDEVFNIFSNKETISLIDIGKTTMFFNALIAQDLDDDLKQLNFGDQCINAVDCSTKWARVSSEAWNKEELHFYGNYENALQPLNGQLEQTDGLSYDSYQTLWAEWNQSSKDLGLVDKGTSQVFQLWRGVGSLKNYICVGGPKRSAINDLLSKIDKFTQKNLNKYPFNSLLLSSPGWGKSYLAKCIAKHFDLHFESFSLSQLATTKDLVNCFDTICSVQNRTDKQLLIFFDEINCKIEGHHAMGLLLSPIWDGSFVKDGKLYKLKPAVWIFASTGLIKELVDPNKGSDFMSRINGPIIELDSLVTTEGSAIRSPLKYFKKELIEKPDLNPEANDNYKTIKSLKGPFRTEQVYLGVSLLNDIFGPISKIQGEVLELFHDILLINGFRSLEFFVSNFKNIERGIVYASNIPKLSDFNELKRHVVLSEKWRVSEGNIKDSNNLFNIETIVTY